MSSGPRSSGQEAPKEEDPAVTAAEGRSWTREGEGLISARQEEEETDPWQADPELREKNSVISRVAKGQRGGMSCAKDTLCPRLTGQRREELGSRSLKDAKPWEEEPEAELHLSGHLAEDQKKSFLGNQQCLKMPA